MSQLALALIVYGTWHATELAILALQLATLAAMLLIQTGRLGPRPPNPVTQTFE